MYLVMCETADAIWYNEFDSLDSAKDYINGFDDHVCCRLFKEISLEV